MPGLLGNERPGTIDAKAIGEALFPFDAFTFSAPGEASPHLDLATTWALRAITARVGTAAALAAANPVLLAGQIGFETDTGIFKIGDGTTAYNSLLSVMAKKFFDYATRSASWLVNTGTNTGGAWSSAVTMPNVPSGAREALCTVSVAISSAQAQVCLEKASGITLDNTASGTNANKYMNVTAPTTNTAGYQVVWIPLDENLQFKWSSVVTNSTVKIGYPIAWR